MSALDRLLGALAPTRAEAEAILVAGAREGMLAARAQLAAQLAALDAALAVLDGSCSHCGGAGRYRERNTRVGFTETVHCPHCDVAARPTPGSYWFRTRDGARVEVGRVDGDTVHYGVCHAPHTPYDASAAAWHQHFTPRTADDRAPPTGETGGRDG